MKSVVIAGSLAQKPGRGGHAWVFLQYLLGFRKLGFDVLFLDRLEPAMCIDESGSPAPIEQSWNLRYLHSVMDGFGLGESYAVLLDGTGQSVGLSRAKLLERVRTSDALINVMGYVNDEDILALAEKRVFLDIDPGFGQMWRDLGLHDVFKGHDVFVTIARNIGADTCTVPTCGLNWISTFQPIVLDYWPVTNNAEWNSRWITTVASWRGAYGPVEYKGKTYGLRAREFRKFVTLPRITSARCQLALDIHSADAQDVDLLHREGWSLVDPLEVANDPRGYAEYIRNSAAEFVVAKGMYVETRSGWVSDRSVCYLASGKAVVAQDTGLSGLLPTTEGLLTFDTVEEAADAVRAIRREPVRHARAARQLAEAHFDSSVVLGSLARQLDL
jgi:hypothetical protein